MGKTFIKSFFLTFIVLCVIVAVAAMAYFQMSPYAFASLNEHIENVELIKTHTQNDYFFESQNKNSRIIRQLQNRAGADFYIAQTMELEKQVPEWLYEQRVVTACPWRSRPFFVEDNFEEYLRFFESRHDLDEETVMWMVNSNSHVPHYANIITDYSDVPLLVNRNHRLPPGFRPTGMVRIRSAEWIQLIPEAEEAFETMRLAAQNDGYTIRAGAGFRTAARQAEMLYGHVWPNRIIATPYHSEHQTGRALDVQNRAHEWLRNCDDARWISENAHNFGFIIRYTSENSHITGFISEPWHITYVGVEIAKYMHENNIQSLEEFIGRNPGAQFGWSRSS